MNILRTFRKSNKKINLKKYILSIFSLIMVTFAWFTYSKILSPNLNLHIAAWDMEYYIGEEKQENPISIDFATLYPQMDEQTMTIDVVNNGETIVDLGYTVRTITIAGTTYKFIKQGQEDTADNYIYIIEPTTETDSETGELITKGKILNDLERFPFTIEIEHIPQLSPQARAQVTIKVNWLGDNDELDTKWGYEVGKYFKENANAQSALTLTLSIDSYQANTEI